MNQSASQRKQELVRQGAAFRSGLQAAVQNLPAAGHAPSALIKTALGGVAGTAFAALKGGGLASLLPLAGTAFSYLSKRHLIKPALRGAAIAGVVALGYHFLKKKKVETPAEN